MADLKPALVESDFSIGPDGPVINRGGFGSYAVHEVSFDFFYFMLPFFDMLDQDNRGDIERQRRNRNPHPDEPLEPPPPSSKPLWLRQAHVVRYAYFFILLRRGLEPTSWKSLSKATQKRVRDDLKKVVSDGFRCWLIEFYGYQGARQVYRKIKGERSSWKPLTSEQMERNTVEVRRINQKGFVSYACNLIANQIRRDRYISGKETFIPEVRFFQDAGVYPPLVFTIVQTFKSNRSGDL